MRAYVWKRSWMTQIQTCGIRAGWQPSAHAGVSGETGNPLLMHCTTRVAVPFPHTAVQASHSPALQ